MKTKEEVQNDPRVVRARQNATEHADEYDRISRQVEAASQLMREAWRSVSIIEQFVANEDWLKEL